MSRFARLATGLRDLGIDINANINKALNIPKVNTENLRADEISEVESR